MEAGSLGRSLRSPSSFDGDARTFRFIEDGYQVSVSTIGKRIIIPLRVSNYHIGKLKGQNPTSAQICQHKEGCWYAHIQLKATAPEPLKNSNVIVGLRQFSPQKGLKALSEAMFTSTGAK